MQVLEDIYMVDMVNVGSTMYRAASGTLDAAGAARFLQQNSQMRRISDGVWDYGGDAGAANRSVDFSQEFAP